MTNACVDFQVLINDICVLLFRKNLANSRYVNVDIYLLGV